MNRPLRSAFVCLLRERRSCHCIDALVRRGGGLFVLAVLSFVAGWLLPDPATFRAYLRDAQGSCFRIAWVTRITTGESPDSGPILLLQTEWTGNGQRSGPGDEDPCTASEVLLSLPPLTESVYRRQDSLLVPRNESRNRPPLRLPIPSELCVPPTGGTCPKRNLGAT